MQVKYAIVKENDEYYDWFAANLEPVPGNEDKFVALVRDYDGYRWEARDADRKVMVSVFVVNDDDDHPTVSAALHRPYDIKKVPARREDTIRSNLASRMGN